MKKIRITAMAKSEYPELMKEYEIPQEIPCTVLSGQSWISENGKCPEGFCSSAWQNLEWFAQQLALGKEPIAGWMKDPGKAFVSCNDGFRPVSFLLEALKDDAAEDDEHSLENTAAG